MRKILLIVLSFVLVANTSFAQDTKEESKRESFEFMGKYGSFVQKEVYDLDSPKIKGIDIQVFIATNVISGIKSGCMSIETHYFNGHSLDPYTGILEYVELDACIKALTYIKDELLLTQPEVYTEIEYQTLNNLKFGAYYSKNKWTVFIYANESISNSAVFINPSNIATLIDIMNQAKAMIAEKTK